ncbi:TPA: AAA family ATPase [Streptococcus suis]
MKLIEISKDSNEKYTFDAESVQYAKNVASFKCIVGKNGSGKTTFLNDIFYERVKFLFRDQDSGYQHTSNSPLPHFDKLYNIVKFSVSIETSYSKLRKAGFFDVSTSGYLYDMTLAELHRKDSIEQVKMTVAYFNSLESLINFTSKTVSVELSQTGQAIKSLGSKYLSSKINVSGKDSVLKVMKLKFLAIFLDKLEEIKESESQEEEAMAVLREQVLDAVGKSGDDKDIDLTFVKQLKGNVYKSVQTDLLKEVMEILEEFVQDYQTFYDHYWPTRETGLNLGSVEGRESLRKLLSLMKNNSSIHEVFSVLEFKWRGLSSGELAIITLLARLGAVEEKLSKEANVLLLIDEVDLGLHPEWQRKWVSDILPIIAEVVRGEQSSGQKKRIVQVIIATHSPIILSDIFSKDIIYLGEDEESRNKLKTFGQNIYSLFKESFFLKDVQGEFSLTFIKELIGVLDELKNKGYPKCEMATIANFFDKYGLNKPELGEERASFEKLVDSIGEQIIRVHLQQVLESIQWSDSEVYDEEDAQRSIKALEAELEEPRASLKDDE